MSDEYRPSIFETVANVRAVELFRMDADRALCGSELSSYESSSPPQGRTAAIFRLATEHTERFLELIGHLPPLIQDVFIQYCILGRTQGQIAETLSIRQSPAVWQALKLGTEAICAIISWGSDPKKMNGHPAAASYRSILAGKAKSKTTRQMRVRVPRNLGSFTVRADDPHIGDFFVHWTQQDHSKSYNLHSENS